MDERDFDVSALEYDFCDPEAASVIADALFINQYLAEAPADIEKVIPFVQGLNESLREKKLADSNVFITGGGWITTSGDTDEDGNVALRDTARMNFSDQEVIPTEFVIHEESYINEEGVGSSYHIYLYGRTLLDMEDDDGEPLEPSYEDCAIDITPETSLRSKGITANRAEQWLTLHYPDEVAEIVERRSSAETASDALVRLRDYSMDVSGYHEMERVEISRNLEAYLEKVLELEQNVPYLIDIEGTVEVISVKNLQHRSIELAKRQQPRIAYLHDAFTVYDENHSLIDIWIRGAIVSRDGKEKIPCRMPLSSISSAVSIRDLL